MRTYLVAVVAPTEQDVIDFLALSPFAPDKEDGNIDSWWIAEYDRHDGSDNDSAIFVPRGSQSDMAHVIREHITHHTDEWNEDGYPYALTDVAGGWFRANDEPFITVENRKVITHEPDGSTTVTDPHPAFAKWMGWS